MTSCCGASPRADEGTCCPQEGATTLEGAAACTRGTRLSAPTILYLHGFNSGPGTVKGQLLARAAAALANPPRVHLPQLHHRPAQAMCDVCAWIEREAPAGRDLTLVGSSLGGFYATWLAERFGARAVLINPAIRPYEDLRAFLGRQRNLYTGEEYDVIDRAFRRACRARRCRGSRGRNVICQRYVRTGDELLDWREAAAFYAGAFQYVAGGGDHGWTDFESEAASVLRSRDAEGELAVVRAVAFGPARFSPRDRIAWWGRSG